MTVSAYLVNDDNQPLPAGLPVYFTVDGLSTVSGITNAEGFASASLALNLAPGTYPITARFNGTIDFTPISTSQNLEVTASWPAWIQNSSTDFNDNTIPGCLDLTTVPGSVRLTGQIVGLAEEGPGTYTLGVGEETGTFTLGAQTFGYRTRFHIDNPNSALLIAGYTITMPLDTASLVTANKLRADGYDLRIARDTGSGIVELDRLLESPNSANTQISFKLQAGIAAGARDSSYYIYYGKPDAVSPPADPANVYFLWDDFDGTAVDLTRWARTGAVTVSGGLAQLALGGDLLSVGAATYGLLEARIRAGSLTTNNVVFWGWEDGVISAPNFLVYQRYPPLAGAVHTTSGTAQVNLAAPVVDSTLWHTYAIRWNPGQAEWFVDGLSKATYSGSIPPVPTAPMSANFNAYQDALELDWVRVRLYAAVAPVISLQTSTTYQYRRGVAVENIATSVLPSGYAVKLTVDTASLTSAGKLLSNGNDLRLVWMDGANPVELDRIAETAFNSAATEIWFKTQAAISPGAADDSYYIFYGSPTASLPPTNPANVFAFYDGFDGTTLDTNKWNRAGTVTVSDGQAHLNTTSYIITRSSLTYGKLEIRLKAASQDHVMFWGWEETPADANNILVFQEQASPGFFNAIYRQGGGTWYQPVIGDPPGGFTNWHIYGVDWRASHAQWTIDGVESLQINSGVPSVPMLININAYSTIPLDVDWVRVRQYFNPEPVVSLANTHIEYASGACEMLSVPFNTEQTSYWKYVVWEGSAPQDTVLSVQIRTADTQEGLASADWVTYPQAVQLITNPAARWIQYRATLSRTDNPLITPELQKVTIYYSGTPTAVVLSSFSGETHQNSAQLDWVTASEFHLLGFNIYRSTSINGAKEKRNTALIEAQNSSMGGASYQFIDDMDPGQHYFYWLQLVKDSGDEIFELPVELNTNYLLFLPMIVR